MAGKKEAGALAQKLIPGTHDPIPKELQDLVDELVKARRKKHKAAGEEKGHNDLVIAKMEELGIDRIPLSDGKDLVLKHPGKVLIKKRSTPPEAQAPEGEEPEEE